VVGSKVGQGAIAPYGYAKLDTDLNKGAGGDFIYLYATSDRARHSWAADTKHFSNAI
jgi:hypothetical protein